jgi:Mg2+/Co2+ transporter CorC
MLTGVFHLHEQEARQVMTPIPAVVTVDISQDVETALRCASPAATRAWSSPRRKTATACAGSCTSQSSLAS